MGLMLCEAEANRACPVMFKLRQEADTEKTPKKAVCETGERERPFNARELPRLTKH